MPTRTRTKSAARKVSYLRGQWGRRRHALLLLLLALPGACAEVDADPSEELRGISSELTGGQRDRGSPNVVLLLSWDSVNPVGTLGSCTANLVAPNVLLTAAHCLVSNRQHYAAYLGDDGRDLGTPIDPGRAGVRAQLHMAREVHPHPRYVTTQGYFDVGVVILQEDLEGIDPLPIHRTTPTASLLSNVSIVGYGKTYDRDPSFAVTKYRADGLSATLDPTHTMTVGDAVRHACVGDSGGPVLADIGGVATILGVDSYSDETGDATRCRIPSRYQRVDPYLDFLDQYVPRGDTGGGEGTDSGVADAGPDGSDENADAGDTPGWKEDAGRSDPGGPVGDAGQIGGGAGRYDGGAKGGDGGTPGGNPAWEPTQGAGVDGCNLSPRPSSTSLSGVLVFLVLVAAFPWRTRRRSARRTPGVQDKTASTDFTGCGGTNLAISLSLRRLAFSWRTRGDQARGGEESER